MFYVKTASVRDLRQDFSQILAWIEAGEEVAITKRRHAVAKLIPWPRKMPAKRKMPDIAARLKKVFGAKIIADKIMKSAHGAEKLGATHSETIGCRSADLFQVAAAGEIGCATFLTFDDKQTAMAKATGLSVKPL